MNGVHDMGGMQNLGPIAPEADEPVFHARWEARVLALVIASPTRGNIDEGRHAREMIPGPRYLSMSYYQKWFRAICEQVAEHGYATRQEIAVGRTLGPFAAATPRLPASAVTAALTRHGSYLREGPSPAFAVGDAVRARMINPDGHTRLPRYVRGRLGVVARLNGTQVFPDVHAHGGGDDPRPLYTIRFSAQELWGEAANPRDSVCVDLWEPYLDRA